MSAIACSSERRLVGGFVRRHESGDCFTQPPAAHSPACVNTSDSERMPGFPMPPRFVGQVRHAMRASSGGNAPPPPAIAWRPLFMGRGWADAVLAKGRSHNLKEVAMARRCQVTNKGVQTGNNVSHANNRTR